MGTITAQSIIEKAQVILQDPSGVRFSDAQLLSWLNEGQLFIYAQRKDSSAKVTNVVLAVGSKQTLPTEADLLLDITRNVTVNVGPPVTVTPGRALRKVSMPLLDAQYPDWHASQSSAVVREYMYDPRVPKTFYVYPPAASGATVEVKYSLPPDALATASEPIAIDDVYAPVLLDYILYRSYALETEESLMQRASLYRQSVEAQLGIKGATDEITNAQAVEA